MGITQDREGLIDAILHRPRGSVIVLTGPSGSGKTWAALALYAACAQPANQGNCLLLAPSSLAADELRAHLVEQSPAHASFSPQIMTFSELIGQILLAGKLPHRLLSVAAKRAALSQIIAELAKAGKLPNLIHLAESPGLVAAIENSIEEIKTSPSADEPQENPAGRWHGDIRIIYQHYQAYLDKHQFCDEYDRYLLARQWLSRNDLPILPNIQVVAADGFTEFSHQQLEILHLLSQRVEKTVLTLTLQNDGRQDLWQWPNRQLAHLRKRFGDQLTEISLPPADGRCNMPAQLAEHIFAGNSTSSDCADALSLIAASGVESECRAIAAWVKTHLHAGHKVQDLTIVAHNLAPYRAVLGRVFAETSLRPPSLTQTLLDAPPARFLMTLIRAADGLKYADVLAVLANSYLQPSRLGSFSEDDRQGAELVVRHGNVLEGREQYARAAEWLAERLSSLEKLNDDDEFASPMDNRLRRLGITGIRRAGELLERLFGLLEPLGRGGTLAEMAGSLRALLSNLDLPRHIAGEGHHRSFGPAPILPSPRICGPSRPSTIFWTTWRPCRMLQTL